MRRDWIDRRLKARHASKGDLAGAMRISQSRLSEVLAEKRRLTAGEAARMAGFLQVPIEELIAAVGEKVAA